MLPKKKQSVVEGEEAVKSAIFPHQSAYKHKKSAIKIKICIKILKLVPKIYNLEKKHIKSP